MSERKKKIENLNYWLNMGAVDLRTFEGARLKVQEAISKLEQELEKSIFLGPLSTASASEPEPLTLEMVQRAMDKIPEAQRPIDQVLVTKLIPPGKVMGTMYEKRRYMLINREDFQDMKPFFALVENGPVFEVFPFEDSIFGMPIREDETLVIKILLYLAEKANLKKEKSLGPIRTDSA